MFYKGLYDYLMLVAKVTDGEDGSNPCLEKVM
jgi:hypothetical protein